MHNNKGNKNVVLFNF